jgi:sugar lactone lactonase YvrE
MYVADSHPRAIHAFDLDAERGTISGARVLISLAEQNGAPDGLTVDAAGDVWVAIHGAGVSSTTPSTACCAKR